jgi:beta-xylosidase
MQRILKKMPKAHADYRAAKAHLKAIYGKIIDGAYKDSEAYIKSMEKWISRWSDPKLATSSNKLEAIVQLG